MASLFGCLVSDPRPYACVCDIELAMQATSLPSSDCKLSFDVKAFQDFLEGYPIPETVVTIIGNKRKAQALYQAFIQSANFWPWVTRISVA